VPILARPLSQRTDAGAAALRRPALALALTALAAAALLSGATPARAQVTSFGGHEYGVQLQAGTATPNTALVYGSGPVVHNNAPYAIYWDPEDKYAPWEDFTSGYLEGVADASGTNALSNVYADATQYRDASGNVAYSSTFRGAYTDVDPLTSAENCTETTPCLSDAQIRTELGKYISANGLPAGLNPSGSPTPIYFVFTPPGTTVCLGATLAAGHCSKPGGTEPLCSYHSFATVNSSTVLYAVLPTTQIAACQNNTSLEGPNELPADVTVNEIADEQIATATDPQFNGWHGASGEEVPDKCRYEFEPLPLAGKEPGKLWNQTIGGIHYYLNDEFNQAGLTEAYPGHHCLNTVTEQPNFTAPTPVRTGDPVTFNATASVVDLGIAKYNWEFGPGETAEVNCEGHTPTFGYTPAQCDAASGTGNPNAVASVVHQYTYGGEYNVTLTITDDGGNVASETHTVTVSGPAKPAPPAPPAAATGSGGSGGASTSTAGGGTSSGSGAAPVAKPIVAPVATAAVASTSLKSVLAKGLSVRYSVNEQVTGHFEVLLAASVAKKIGLKGPFASGLPEGTAPEIVIAKAILVTTQGGRNSVKILFGKKTAKLLRKLHKVSLMVRLIVRNGLSSSATSTTTTNSLVTLTH
jgi:PKD domain